MLRVHRNRASTLSQPLAFRLFGYWLFGCHSGLDPESMDPKVKPWDDESEKVKSSNTAHADPALMWQNR